MAENETKTLTPTVTEDPNDVLSRLRADALLAVATDAAACMQLERFSNGRRKAGGREAKAVAAAQGAPIVHALAILATTHNGLKIAAIARRHWAHARDALKSCRTVKKEA